MSRPINSMHNVIREAIFENTPDGCDENFIAKFATNTFIDSYVMTPSETIDEINDLSGMDLSELAKKYFDYRRFINDCCDEGSYIIMKFGFTEDDKKYWKIGYSFPPGYMHHFEDDCKIVRIEHLVQEVREAFEEEQEKEKIITDDTIVTGIQCTKCKNFLPAMTCKQHLDGDFNQICPHGPITVGGENGTTGTTLSHQEYLEKKEELIKKIVELKDKIHAK